MKRIVLNSILILCVIAFVISAVYLVRYFMAAKDTSDQIEELVELKEDDSLTEEEIKEAKQSGILKQYVKLYKKNSDLVGWIQVPDTEIDYPVMQNKQDSQFYLHRNYKGEGDVNGLPFLAEGCDIKEPKSNFLIYGHHMKSGLMFTGIMKYKDESFYKSNPYIRFDTLYEEASYSILSAFYTEISDSKKSFDFYNKAGEMSRKKFDKYVKEVKNRSLYDTKTKAEYGESLITLVTCSYHVDNGRFVVVAVKKS